MPSRQKVKERLGAACQKRDGIANVNELDGQTESLPGMLARDTLPFVYSLQQRKGAKAQSHTPGQARLARV